MIAYDALIFSIIAYLEEYLFFLLSKSLPDLLVNLLQGFIFVVAVYAVLVD